MHEIKIAIIDDDLVFCSTLKELVENYNADFFTSSQEGIKAIAEGDYNILILDYFIDEMTGADVVKKIREFNQEIYIMLLTGFSHEVPAIDVLKNIDVQDYCEKSARNFEAILIRAESAVKSVIQINNIKNIEKTKNFAQRLKVLREINSELQADLASVLGVSRQAIGSYESGRSEPNFDVLKIISKHYKVSIDYLLGNLI